MNASHEEILTLLRAGASCTTVDVHKPTVRSKPAAHGGDGTVLLRPRRATLDEMVALGLLHYCYRQVGVEGTCVEEYWHLGPGGELAVSVCEFCKISYCPICYWAV